MGRRSLLSIVLALAVAPSAASVVAPKTQTCKPAKLPLTFTLPSDWSCEGPPPYGNVLEGASAGGMAPGFVLQLNIYTTRVGATGPIATYASRLVAAVRVEYAGTRHLKVERALTTVGASVPAVRLTLTADAPSGGTGKAIRIQYFFLHAGSLYEFDYAGTAEWMTKDLGAIAASARSIHFPITA